MGKKLCIEGLSRKERKIHILFHTHKGFDVDFDLDKVKEFEIIYEQIL